MNGNQNHLNGATEYSDNLSESRANNNQSYHFFDENGDEDATLQYFKNCVVRDSRAELIEKMHQTVEFRRNILSQTPDEIQKIFPFYFVDAELV